MWVVKRHDGVLLLLFACCVVWVAQYEFKFNMTGMMGNVQRCPGAEVHGIVHQLTRTDMSKLELVEGKGVATLTTAKARAHSLWGDDATTDRH